MKKQSADFVIADHQNFQRKMLNWINRFNIFCFLDNSGYMPNTYECIAGVGSITDITLTQGKAFRQLHEFHESHPGWLFGHLGYDINNEQPGNKSPDAFSDGFFFSPSILFRLHKTELTIETRGDNPFSIYEEIEAIIIEEPKSSNNYLKIESKISKDEYLAIIRDILMQIKKGYCYEINFCQEFSAMDATIDPLTVYRNLQLLSPNPFSAFYRVNDNYCLCASPERFLKKTGNELMSQPIKGTSVRDEDPVKDSFNKDYLATSTKEKSENVMIVDLVRNDLSRLCAEGSVHVEELFGIYSFPQVYQMISTIKGLLPEHVHWTKAIEATFPMGSMTGAPKKKVVELIRQYESGPRGLFSGSIGYVTPDGDFDFNVVIRSIFYNPSRKYLSYWAGSGITFNSNPEAEYDECMAKVNAIIKVLG